jgi:hypothetical protein
MTTALRKRLDLRPRHGSTVARKRQSAISGPKTCTVLQNLRQKSHSWALAAREKGFSAGIVADFNDNGINGVEELGR